MNLVNFNCRACGRPSSAYEGTIRADERLCRTCRLEQMLALDGEYIRRNMLILPICQYNPYSLESKLLEKRGYT